MKYIEVDKLKSILGIEKCEECKFGGSYCADCDPLYFDAHYVINKINELMEPSDEEVKEIVRTYEEKGLIIDKCTSEWDSEFDKIYDKMRPATQEEIEATRNYIEGISEYTGRNIFDV